MPLDHYITLGRSGLRVSPLCLGTMTFGEDLGWGSSVEESQQIIDRLDYNEIPPKVEYSLTTFGRTLGKALAPLCVWGTEHVRAVEKLVSHRHAG